MEFAIETIFKIAILVVVTLVIIHLLIYYYQKAKIDLPDTKLHNKLQIILVRHDEDVAKAIYGCYSLGGFGKLKQELDCYIMKIQTSNLNDYNIRKILFENFSLGDVYEKITFSNLAENTTILVYYSNGYIKFRII